MINVANSLALNNANFCLPCKTRQNNTDQDRNNRANIKFTQNLTSKEGWFDGLWLAIFKEYKIVAAYGYSMDEQDEDA